MKKVLTLMLMLTITALTGCGQTGDLYLPDHQQQNEQTQ
ncbi:MULTISPECIES: lipoprotein [unclassified Vibrio]|uniref:Lipoprotein n=1 Tax=Vibrio sp. HB236076 TaxID=3232307 RepID=A0AB39HFY4_9VIBR|nr:lipoprotein [Vibrio sp. HB161653]MDP5255710.1 lipoprotein [Vibrio sp. HB161653]